MRVNFEQLNRDTWRHNNIGNNYHPSNTGYNNSTDFTRLNAETYSQNNKISLADYYNTAWKKW